MPRIRKFLWMSLGDVEPNPQNSNESTIKVFNKANAEFQTELSNAQIF